ncbi:MAG: TIGR03013 family PEP-CTERM/XrtA system glycosyltransferase [Dechloromonas sp.]|nr:TIGR03013 family PEP-CTERM/XrtA system glycosyltransferase [Dechloromonas sp.]
MVRMFNHWVRWRTLLQVLFDFSFVFVAMIIATLWVGAGLPIDIAMVAVYAVILGVIMLLLNAWFGFYQRFHGRTIHQTRARAVLSLYLAVPLAYGLFLLLPVTAVSREFLQLSAMSAVFGMLVNRVSTVHAPPTQMLVRRILVFGVGVKALAVRKALNKSDPAALVVGFYPASNEEEIVVPADQVLSSVKHLTDTARQLKVDEIVVAVTERRGGALPLRELLDCKLAGIRVLDLASHFEQTLGQIRLDSLYAGWLIFGDGFGQGAWRSFVKRAFDIACALVLLLLAAPVMLLTALIISLESAGPIFYRQERVGLNGRLFNVIKFRSMRTDAEKDGKPRWATSGDSRVTRVGRVIRKLRVDELPQLISVLNGDMSLVGPRPERPFFVDQLTREIPFYAVRHSVKPGVTGWAQVRYHYGASVEDSAEKLQYDLYYVKNHTLFLDILVLFETVGVVLTAKGAQ